MNRKFNEDHNTCFIIANHNNYVTNYIFLSVCSFGMNMNVMKR